MEEVVRVVAYAVCRTLRAPTPSLARLRRSSCSPQSLMPVNNFSRNVLDMARTTKRTLTSASGFDQDEDERKVRVKKGMVGKRLRSDCDPLYAEKVEAMYPTTLKQRRVGARVLQALFDVIEKDGRLYDLFFGDLGINFQEVRMSPDRKVAYVRWTAGVGFEDRAEVALNKSTGFLRSKLARALSYRRVPSLVFISDYLTDEEAALEQIFDRIALENKTFKDVASVNPHTNKPEG